MVLRRVRAMLPGSVLIPVSISRAVFGHRNTNSPMLRSQRGPTHSTGYGDHGELRPRAAFAGLWISAQAVESKGSLPGVAARRTIPAGKREETANGTAAKPRATHGRGERHSPACGGNGPRARGPVLPRLAGDLVFLAASAAGAGASGFSRACARHARLWPQRCSRADRGL